MSQVTSQRLQVVYWPIEKLIPFARNPRTHSEEQIAVVCKRGWAYALSSVTQSALAKTEPLLDPSLPLEEIVQRLVFRAAE
jgi:hypothetical protein